MHIGHEMCQKSQGIGLLLAFMFIVVPTTFNAFWLDAVMGPTLIFALAAIGLNILTGYAGQLSLGTGGFMGCGAYACYKLTSIFPEANIILVILCSGFFAAAIGFVFGFCYCWAAQFAHQGFLSGCGYAGLAILPRMVLWPGSLAIQLQ